MEGFVVQLLYYRSNLPYTVDQAFERAHRITGIVKINFKIKLILKWHKIRNSHLAPGDIYKNYEKQIHLHFKRRIFRKISKSSLNQWRADLL